MFFFFFFFFFFWLVLGFQLRVLCLQTGALPFEPHLQSIFALLMNYLPWLALNHNPSEFNLPSC
jgi:hypothetical protein